MSYEIPIGQSYQSKYEKLLITRYKKTRLQTDSYGYVLETNKPNSGGNNYDSK